MEGSASCGSNPYIDIPRENVAAVEDAFLCGEWTQALQDSRSILTAHMVQRSNSAVLTMKEERVLSVYLQAVFELDLDDEVETPATIAKGFAPLPSGIAIQFCNLLLAMNRRVATKQTLQGLLESFAVNGGVDFSTEQYGKAVEMMALQLLLPDEGIEAARTFVVDDNVLDEGVKLQLFSRIQTRHLAAEETKKDSVQTSAVNRRVNNVSRNSEVTDATSQCMSTAFVGAQQPATKQDNDSSCYVVIGGTAIALAVIAAGALRYRDKIYECISNTIPAISKSVEDAKYALFEA